MLLLKDINIYFMINKKSHANKTTRSRHANIGTNTTVIEGRRRATWKSSTSKKLKLIDGNALLRNLLPAAREVIGSVIQQIIAQTECILQEMGKAF